MVRQHAVSSSPGGLKRSHGGAYRPNNVNSSSSSCSPFLALVCVLLLLGAFNWWMERPSDSYVAPTLIKMKPNAASPGTDMVGGGGMRSRPLHTESVTSSEDVGDETSNEGDGTGESKEDDGDDQDGEGGEESKEGRSSPEGDDGSGSDGDGDGDDGDPDGADGGDDGDDGENGDDTGENEEGDGENGEDEGDDNGTDDSETGDQTDGEGDRR